MIIAFDLVWFCDLGLWVLLIGTGLGCWLADCLLPRPRQPKEHDDATTTELH